MKIIRLTGVFLTAASLFIIAPNIVAKPGTGHSFGGRPSNMQPNAKGNLSHHRDSHGWNRHHGGWHHRDRHRDWGRHHWRHNGWRRDYWWWRW